MRHPTPGSRQWKAGATAIAAHLASASAPVLLYHLNVLADQAARAAGRRTDLFPSLFNYVDLLPANWSTAWIGGDGAGDRLYYAIPRGWKAGHVEQTLTATLMGSRDVHVVDSPDA